MAIRVEDSGSNNVVDIPQALLSTMNGFIKIIGNDSYLCLHEGSVNDDFYIHVGSRVRIEIGANCRLGKLQIYTTQDNNLTIGANASFNYQTRLHMHEPSSLAIGNDALFADGVYITTSDMHSIIDAQTGKRINPSQDVVISDHVWLGMNVTVLKGTHIGHGSIIGACSLVAGNIPSLSVAAGQPARVIRQGVTWRKELV
jgi:acetyltransferase-like isoleucine patch superfamily enzyme